MDEARFARQRAFILEADKEKNILRQTHISGYSRRENDAEHAWHMAIMIYLLKEYANDPFDTEKAMMMALIHDIVEIDAGDTYAYDTAAIETQAEREAQAAERIFGLLPEDQKRELQSLFEEFEQGESPEARFARVMDNLQPLLLNDFNGGRDWKRHGIKAEQVFRRQGRSRFGSEEIWQFSKALIERNAAEGNLRGSEQPYTEADATLSLCALTHENAKDLHVANQPFDVIGRLSVSFADGTWTLKENLYEIPIQKQYPNYDGAVAEDYVKGDGRIAYLAYQNGVCVGQILLAKSWNGYTRVEDLSVAATYRGAGIGTALMEKAELWAMAQGTRGISVECQDNNILASRFLQKNGFFVGGVDACLYQKLGKPYADETAVYWYKTVSVCENG